MMNAEVAAHVARDVSNEVSPEDSKLTYTKELLELRSRIQDRWKAWTKDHPDAIMTTPD